MGSVRTYVLLELGELLGIILLIIVIAQFVRIPLWLAIAIPAGKFLKFLLVYPSVRRTGRQPVATGLESLLRKRGLVVDPLDPEGYVKIGGELWRARTISTPIAPGKEVEVCGLDRTRLLVKEIGEPPSPA
jgi:membrane-bound serine protease (ClpP class)